MWEPPKVKPSSLADYLEIMSRAVFTAGISWKVIESKWDGTREAFDNFDAHKVSAYTPDDVERLMADPRVVHNLKKIEAVIGNAGELIVTEREFGSIDAYLSSFADNEELIKDLHHRFAFLGESVAHFFLFGVGFNLPEQEKWAHAHFEHSEHSHHSG
jgi:3-methyladenine DNA glycosylase Tag